MASTIISKLTTLRAPGHVRLHRLNQPGVHDRRDHALRSHGRSGQGQNRTRGAQSLANPPQAAGAKSS